MQKERRTAPIEKMTDAIHNEELNEDEVYTYTLTDEDGKEYEFELLGTCEMDGKTYYAMAPLGEESEEYVILRAEEDGDEVNLMTIEDDDEFDKVAEFFDDELFSEIDYDAE